MHISITIYTNCPSDISSAAYGLQVTWLEAHLHFVQRGHVGYISETKAAFGLLACTRT
jgi:hypothetical protein